jgi:type I restriction enzyme S subunit
VFNTITRESFQAIQVLLPPLPEQKAIAGVLSSLDDKIDLLHRQNKTLEAMAETLFRQWFIEGAEDDWGVVELQNYGEIICGKTPSKKILEYFGNEIPFIKIPDMHQQVFILSTSDELSLKGAQSQAKKTLPEGAICISCIATVGLVSLTSKPSQTNQQINSIIPKECYYRYFLYLLMKSSYDILHSMASGGTATLNLNTGDFSRMKVILPPHARIIEFHNLVTPMFRKILKNQTQIQLLAEQRNTIIPKLMSGEVRVELE